MLLIKRIIAGLINLSFFALSVILVFPLLNSISIELEHKYFILLVFLISFFLPILFLKSTLGYKIFKINNNSYKKQLIKYSIYYLLFSGLIGRYLTLFEASVNLSFGHASSFTIVVIPFITLFVLSIVLFACSMGRYNLIDFFLNIIYSKKRYNRSSILILIIWLSASFTTIFIFVSGDKYFFNEYFSKFETLNLDYNFTNYYPKDVFDEYIYFQTDKIDLNNDIISFSDPNSFFQDRFLAQKTIFALMNKQTFENEIRRYLLSLQLIIYSNINDVFNGISNISQTKILLIYNEPQTYFSKKHISTNTIMIIKIQSIQYMVVYNWIHLSLIKNQKLDFRINFYLNPYRKH